MDVLLSSAIVTFDFSGLRGIMFVVLMFLLITTIARIVFHLYEVTVLPESCLIILLGIVFGAIALSVDSDLTRFQSEVFFFVFIPPIILEAGYFLRKGFFFNNLGTIALYAVVGTFFNTVLTGVSLYGVAKAGLTTIEMSFAEALTFGSLISAVDPVAVLAIFEETHVNETLNMLVFGESVVNDAISIVLYNLFINVSEQDNVTAVVVPWALGKFIVTAIGGIVVGIAIAFLSAYLTKYSSHIPVIEPLLVIVMAILSYVTAELFHFSGIMAILFCGITMSHYTEHNITHKSHTTVKYSLKMISSTTETVVFMFLGMSLVLEADEWDGAFIAFTYIFCSVYRALSTLTLTYFANKKRIKKIPLIDQFIMIYGGLRGAIAFALAFTLPESVAGRDMMITCTLVIVMITTIVQGGSIKPILNKLKSVKRAEEHKRYTDRSLSSFVFPRTFDIIDGAIESIVGSNNHQWRCWWRDFDKRYLQPLLLVDKGNRRHALAEALDLDMFREAFRGVAEDRDALDQGHTSASKKREAEHKRHLMKKYMFERKEDADRDKKRKEEEHRSIGIHTGEDVELDAGVNKFHASERDIYDFRTHHSAYIPYMHHSVMLTEEEQLAAPDMAALEDIGVSPNASYNDLTSLEHPSSSGHNTPPGVGSARTSIDRHRRDFEYAFSGGAAPFLRQLTGDRKWVSAKGRLDVSTPTGSRLRSPSMTRVLGGVGMVRRSLSKLSLRKKSAPSSWRGSSNVSSRSSLDGGSSSAYADDLDHSPAFVNTSQVVERERARRLLIEESEARKWEEIQREEKLNHKEVGEKLAKWELELRARSNSVDEDAGPEYTVDAEEDEIDSYLLERARKREQERERRRKARERAALEKRRKMESEQAQMRARLATYSMSVSPPSTPDVVEQDSPASSATSSLSGVPTTAPAPAPAAAMEDAGVRSVRQGAPLPTIPASPTLDPVHHLAPQKVKGVGLSPEFLREAERSRGFRAPRYSRSLSTEKSPQLGPTDERAPAIMPVLSLDDADEGGAHGEVHDEGAHADASGAGMGGSDAAPASPGMEDHPHAVATGRSPPRLAVPRMTARNKNKRLSIKLGRSDDHLEHGDFVEVADTPPGGTGGSADKQFAADEGEGTKEAEKEE